MNSDRHTGLRLTALLCITMGLAAAAGTTLYVSPRGDDSWTGTAPRRGLLARTKGPFRTLERARDRIRAMKEAGNLPEGGVTVILRRGTYELAQPFALTAEDSGTESAPIVYRGEPGKTVRLLGGRVITNFEPVIEPAELAQLDDSARGKVWKADLKALGIEDVGEATWNKRGAPPGLELFFDDEPMTLARWPNQGFTSIVDTDGPIEKNRRDQDVSRTGRIVYDGDRPRRWLEEKDPWVHGYWFHDWSDQRHPIGEIDPEKRVIACKPPLHSYGYRKDRWFYAFNLLCEIDSPGEWYLDRETAGLYFWPPHTDFQRGRPTVSMIENLVVLDGASHVTLRGMTLEASRGTAVRIKDGTANRVAGCLIRNTGLQAVDIRDSFASGVLGCDITNTALGGIVLNGGVRKTLTRGELYAVNNHIWRYGRWQRMYTPAVSVRGVGHRVAHNLIHDAPHQAIGFVGNDHVIELNEIHSVCHESNDAGAIYSGANWSFRGTVIRHNYMHHVTGFRGRGCVGVYLDDILSGHHIVGNVFYKVTRAAFIGGGSDCTVVNNIFVDCNPALHIDARGMGKYDYGASTMQPRRLKEMPYQESPWKEHYPELVNMLENDPHIPKNNRVANNISVGGRWDSVNKHAREHGIFENNLINEDPLFVDAENLDFRLRPESPAWALGFQPIPIEKIGLYHDEFRASWPVHHEPLPDQAPTATVRKNHPRHVAWRVAPGTITVDGKPDEWPRDAKTAIQCGDSVGGTASRYVTRAWAAFDGQALYLLAVNPIDPSTPLRTDGDWGQLDAAEFAFQNPVHEKSLCYQSPIFNPRGFPDGRKDSVSDAGAPHEQARHLHEAMTFAATVDGDCWIGEWRIPLASVGIDAATVKELPFNLNIRRMADKSWMVWTRTGGPIWAVRDGGRIVLRED